MRSSLSVIALTCAFAACSGVSGGDKRSGPRGGDQPPPGPEEAFPDAPPAADCAGVPLLTLDELAAGKRAGETIAVDGVPKTTVFCTLLDCGNARCCNSCGGGYILHSSERHQVSLQNVGGCSGMDCSLSCKPFGRNPKTAYRFVGKHIFTPAGKTSLYGKSDIKVERFCKAPPPGETPPSPDAPKPAPAPSEPPNSSTPDAPPDSPTPDLDTTNPPR